MAFIFKPNKRTPTVDKLLKDQRVSVVVENFHGVNWWEQCKVFPVFTVFNSPKDFPGKYVVRIFDGKNPLRLITVSDTLEEARKTIPPMFMRTDRSEKDDPIIVETWI